MSVDETTREAQGGAGATVAPDAAGPIAPGVPEARGPSFGDEPQEPQSRQQLEPPDPPGAPPDDLVTRLLCASTYLRDSVADQVARDLLWPSVVAMGPLCQVDAHRLLQHARRARAARRARDRRLAAVLGGLVLTILIWAGLALTRPMSPVAVAILAILLLIWVYGCAVTLTARHLLDARRAALAAAYGPDDTDDAVAPASLDVALRELNQANVVFYEANSSPFLGSGSKIDGWRLTVDLSKGQVSPGARPRGREHKQPDAFTAADLQEYLRRAVPEVIDPRPSSGHRLHVRGGTTAPLADLFRIGPTGTDLIDGMRFRRPVNRVAPEVIRRHLDEPSEAARVYTFFQHSAWGGQVVVTLFVRAKVSNRTLFVEGQVYALRPLAAAFYDVRGLSQRPWVELVSVLRRARAIALPLMFASPNRVYRALQNPLRPIEVRRLEREITGRRDLDFGANHSLREQSAARYDHSDHFPAVDEQMFHGIFNRRVLECIGDFLVARNVDTVEFAHQQAAIVNRSVYHGDIYGPLDRSGGPAVLIAAEAVVSESE